MRKRNNVAQLHRTAEHRKAMLRNMVTSFFYHEQISSTVSKVKAAQRAAEKLITKAKNANDDNLVHSKRTVFKTVKDQEVLTKLFNDIGPRYKETNGGYTRIIKVGRRESDNSEMAILELVNRKSLVELKEERSKSRAEFKKSKKVAPAAEVKDTKEAKDSKKEKKKKEKSKD